MSSEAARDTERRRGLILVLSSPSGAGKTSISRALLEQEHQAGDPISLSISVTTRPKRPSEVEGVHYHFVSQRKFDQMRDGGDLLEWAEVHGNCYGTPREPVEQALADGRDILFDIDWQGTEQVVKSMPDDVVPVFILPPSAGELKARLERRAEDSDDVIARRLAAAKDEIAHWSDYRYVLVNHELETCVSDVRSILHAERRRRERQIGLDGLVKSLIAGL